MLDAAYAEYVRRNDYESGIELVATSENVVMCRTFSKIHGLAALRLGWLYGPPDVFDSHPKDPEWPVATEIWTYRHVEGLGDNEFITFIDRTGRGDFRLAPGNAH